MSQEEKVFGRQDFLDMPKPEVVKFFSPALKAHVYLREMSALEYESYSNSLVEFKTDAKGNPTYEHRPEGMRLKYLVRMLCDAKGNRLFKDNEYELLGAQLVGKDSQNALREIYQEAMRINGGTDEELEKNLSAEEEKDSSFG